MNETLLTALALIPALVLAIVFHEIAHGWSALALGDPTAKERKRLSLNPLRHVDPIGTIVLPGFLAMVGAPVFGWAKPVPVNKWRLRNPRFGMMAVAAAGPGSNLVLAGLGAVVLGLLVGSAVATPGEAKDVIGYLGQGHLLPVVNILTWSLVAANYFILINIFLALFNLLPIPPFDGSHIVEGLLPPDAASVYAKLRPFGFPLVFLILLVLPQLIPGFDLIDRYVLPPVLWLRDQYLHLAIAVAGG